jgi:predicted enzyme related to lactoylglutathione lyase
MTGDNNMSSSRNQFCWNELATTDTQAAKEFYSRSFGWTFVDHEMEGGSYTIFKQDGNDLAGMWHIPKDKAQEIPPHWMSYIAVNNLEDMLAKVQKNGATVKMPTTKAGDFGKFAIIIDPTGAHIALWEATQK